VRLKLAVEVSPSLTALMVMVWVPMAADEAAVSFKVLAPAAGLLMVAGEKAAVTPFGNPVAERVTDEP
jgi:hypothetical protein